jgi:DNA polymerase IIIc chi subunit
MNININAELFDKLKIAAQKQDIKAVYEIIHKIERDRELRDLAREVYKLYRKTKNQETLQLYNDIKHNIAELQK